MLTKPKIGVWLSLGNPIITEMVSMSTVDWMLFDMEHGFGMESDILSNLLATRNSGKYFFARVGGLNLAQISRIIDWGVDGVMIPHVESREMATKCVASVNYPPLGIKGYSSSSRMYAYGNQKKGKGHKIPLLIAQIESIKGVENCKDIASVEGINMLFVGPSDLKLDIVSKGLSVSETLKESIDTIFQVAKICDKKVGILANSVEEVKKYSLMGFDYISFGSDLKFIREGLLKYEKLF